MRDQQQPKYLVVGLDDSFLGTVYQIERCIDRAVCGAIDHGPDGRVTEPRQWLHADDACRYLDQLTEGAAGTGVFDAPVAWIAAVPYSDDPLGVTGRPTVDYTLPGRESDCG